MKLRSRLTSGEAFRFIKSNELHDANYKDNIFHVQQNPFRLPDLLRTQQDTARRLQQRHGNFDENDYDVSNAVSRACDVIMMHIFTRLNFRRCGSWQNNWVR